MRIPMSYINWEEMSLSINWGQMYIASYMVWNWLEKYSRQGPDGLGPPPLEHAETLWHILHAAAGFDVPRPTLDIVV